MVNFVVSSAASVHHLVIMLFYWSVEFSSMDLLEFRLSAEQNQFSTALSGLGEHGGPWLGLGGRNGWTSDLLGRTSQQCGLWHRHLVGLEEKNLGQKHSSSLVFIFWKDPWRLYQNNRNKHLVWLETFCSRPHYILPLIILTLCILLLYSTDENPDTGDTGDTQSETVTEAARDPAFSKVFKAAETGLAAHQYTEICTFQNNLGSCVPGPLMSQYVSFLNAPKKKTLIWVSQRLCFADKLTGDMAPSRS